MPQAARDRLLSLLRTAVHDGGLIKLTLGHYRGADATVQNLTIRPVALKSGPQLSFLWRHATQHITKNSPPDQALAEIAALLGSTFLDAHLFTRASTAHLQSLPDGKVRLKIHSSPLNATPTAQHDAPKSYVVPPDAPWLRALGVTNDRAVPREGMADKFRQIQKFAELLTHLLADAALPHDQSVHVADMGSGKGYLTFAVAQLLGPRATIRGIEARPELVALCNRVAVENELQNLTFVAGKIGDLELVPREPKIENRESKTENPLDVLIALHACDTATDDALAQGIAADARLLVVAPCCQKELRRQLTAPPILADALRHGIFQERQSEFVTDSLRAQLLEWAGYRTKVFEFISTEHTAKNLMIAATKTHPRQPADSALAERIRAFAHFYGIRSQALAARLNFSLAG